MSTSFLVPLLLLCLGTFVEIATAGRKYSDFTTLRAALENGRLVTLILSPDSCSEHNYPVGHKANVSVVMRNWWVEEDEGRTSTVVHHNDLIEWEVGRVARLRKVEIHSSGMVHLEEVVFDRSLANAVRSFDPEEFALNTYRHRCVIGDGAVFRDAYPEDYETFPLWSFEDLASELEAGRWVTGQLDLTSCLPWNIRLKVVAFDFAKFSFTSSDPGPSGDDQQAGDSEIMTTVFGVPQIGYGLDLRFRRDGDVVVTSVELAPGFPGQVVKKICRLERDFQLRSQRFAGKVEVPERSQLIFAVEGQEWSGNETDQAVVKGSVEARSPISVRESENMGDGFLRLPATLPGQTLENFVELESAWMDGAVIEAFVNLTLCKKMFQEEAVSDDGALEIVLWESYLSGNA